MLLEILARQVVANPTAFEGAFPVAEQPVDETRTASMWELPGIFGRSAIEELLPHQQALMEHLNRLMTPNLTATGAAIMAQNSLHRNSVAQRVLDEANRRVSGEPLRSTYPDLNAPIDNGEPVHQDHCYLCNADKLCVIRRVDSEVWGSALDVSVCSDCLSTRWANSYNRPPTGSPFPNMNAPSTDLSGARITPEQFDNARRVLRSTPRRMEWRVYGDGDGGRGARPDFIAIDDVDHPTREARMMAHAEERGRALAEQAANQSYGRPDHYRVRPGQCSCGFKSAWANDMDMHLTDAPTDTGDGIPKRWRVCECGESRLCREVRVPVFTLAANFHESPPSSSGPVEETIYLCDACCQRRGIGR